MTNDSRLLNVMCLNYALLELLQRNPSKSFASDIERAMFLPRTIEKIREYLGGEIYDELQECMFLSDLSDDVDEMTTSANRSKE